MADHDLDVSGYQCPLPVLKAARKMRSMASGDVLRLLATDPAASIDVAHFCAEQGHELLSEEQRDGALLFTIRKGLAQP
jgi:tRNA 2-thiouridine synthesizing protein A